MVLEGARSSCCLAGACRLVCPVWLLNSRLSCLKLKLTSGSMWRLGIDVSGSDVQVDVHVSSPSLLPLSDTSANDVELLEYKKMCNTPDLYRSVSLASWRSPSSQSVRSRSNAS